MADGTVELVAAGRNDAMVEEVGKLEQNNQSNKNKLDPLKIGSLSSTADISVFINGNFNNS